MVKQRPWKNQYGFHLEVPRMKGCPELLALALEARGKTGDPESWAHNAQHTHALLYGAAGTACVYLEL